MAAPAEQHPCCPHCPDDPQYHAENPPNSHTVGCSECDRDHYVAARLAEASGLNRPILVVVDADAAAALTEALEQRDRALDAFGQPSMAELPDYDEVRADWNETVADAAGGLIAHLRRI